MIGHFASFMICGGLSQYTFVESTATVGTGVPAMPPMSMCFWTSVSCVRWRAATTRRRSKSHAYVSVVRASPFLQPLGNLTPRPGEKPEVVAPLLEHQASNHGHAILQTPVQQRLFVGPVRRDEVRVAP